MNKKLKKVLSVLFLSLSIFTIKANAATGWIKQNNGKWAYSMGNTWCTDGQYNINGTYYMFDKTGYMVTGWYKDSNGNWYYCYQDGQVACNTVIDGYKLNEKGIWVDFDGDYIGNPPDASGELVYKYKTYRFYKVNNYDLDVWKYDENNQWKLSKLIISNDTKPFSEIEKYAPHTIENYYINDENNGQITDTILVKTFWNKNDWIKYGIYIDIVDMKNNPSCNENGAMIEEKHITFNNLK